MAGVEFLVGKLGTYIVCVLWLFPHPKSPRHDEKERRYNLVSFILFECFGGVCLSGYTARVLYFNFFLYCIDAT